MEQLPSTVLAIAQVLHLANAVALVRPLFLDQWPTQPLLHLAVLTAYAGVALWVTLALTRKRLAKSLTTKTAHHRTQPQ